jgi:geranylgeranyl reductase family protein
MIRCDAVIVGGGPAGSTCARLLRRAGWSVVVIDRARFPRDKVCAGWVTPGIWRLLELDPAAYRATGLVLQEIHGFRVGVMGGWSRQIRYPGVVSYAIRRCEFDHFLLRRADADVHDGAAVTSLDRVRNRWVVNERYEAPVLVGAGGHFCPVARHLRGDAAESQPVVAQEVEFRLGDGAATIDEDVPELFFCRDLDGYAWCVRKGEYLNVGIGRRHSDGFIAHRQAFAALLDRAGKVRGDALGRWCGHAYLAGGAGLRPMVGDGVLLIGDAAGLAYPESGEGICPAIESGIAGAKALVRAAGTYDAEHLRPYEAVMRRLHPPASAIPLPKRAVAAMGRALLGSKLFARHLVLDRWFLRRYDEHEPIAS